MTAAGAKFIDENGGGPGLACYILGSIPRPSFGRMEGHNVHRIVELADQ
jgi:hypothetical protein